MVDTSSHHRLVTERDEWEALLAQRPEANFLQSWNWGAFQEQLGRQVWRVVVLDAHEQIGGQFQAVRERAKRGSYLVVAGGPLLDWSNDQMVVNTFAALRSLAQAHGCSFVRFRPQVEATSELEGLVRGHGARVAPMHVTADLTLQLDLTPSEEEILTQMRKNTRGEIRKAERMGIRVESSSDPAHIREFYEQQLSLAEKHGFVPFSYQFLYEQFQVFARENQAALFHARSAEGELLASAFIIFYHGEAVYHYGISTPANARMPGSPACQWAAIKAAKHRGCHTYNFWGIAPEDQREHRFAGVSLFKRGFGGREVQYLPAHDIPVSWRYWTTYVFELLRKKLRRL